jgi:ribosomal protein S18 acetylase RimI-like enzyme
MESVLIRPFCRTDDTELNELIARCRLYTYPSNQHGVTISRLKQVTHILPLVNNDYQMLPPRHYFNNGYCDGKYVAVSPEGAILGGVKSIEFEKEVGKIVSLYVDPSYKGCGIGRQLMSIALEQLRNKRSVILEVVSYTFAVKFYEKFGFKIVSESNYNSEVFDETTKKFSTLKLPTYLMEKTMML